MNVYIQWTDGGSRDRNAYDLADAVQALADDIKEGNKTGREPETMFIRVPDDRGTKAILYYHHKGVTGD